MEFEGQYLTYSEYQELGGTLDQLPFNLLEYQARKEIDLNTKLRLVNETSIPDEVKMCLFELITTLEKYVQEQGFNVNYTSESIDGYSKSFATAGQIAEIVKGKRVELDDIILRDLYGVIVNGEHVIYRG
jgi:hypothetical protein